MIEDFGFINEFIFGILVGDAVRDGFLKVEEMSERFIDMSATAFAVREEGIRKEYYGKIRGYLKQSSNICRLIRLTAIMRAGISEASILKAISFLRKPINLWAARLTPVPLTGVTYGRRYLWTVSL